jgi:LacI family transcriptional regulator
MLRGILNAPTRPTAVFSLSYVSSISLLRFFNQNHNLSKQFSLLFFDDSPLFRTISPAITVISQDMNAMAQTCVKEMINRIEAPEIRDHETIYVPTKFEKRNSVSQVNM